MEDAEPTPQRLAIAGVVMQAAIALWMAASPAAAATADPPVGLQHLAAGSAQDFEMQLREGQALDVDIEQLNGQVSLQWSNSSGDESPMVFTLDGAHGHVRATLVARQDGTWRFKILARRAREADYLLRVLEVRSTRADDAPRAAATLALAVGETLRARGAKLNALSAEQSYREAIDGAALGHDACALRAALNGLGHLQIALGRYEAAGNSSQRALDADCGDPASRAHSLRIAQSALQWRGDLDGTIRLGNEALEIYRRTGDRAFQGLILGNLSGAYDQEGETSHAMQAASEALELARETQDAEGVVFDEETIGGIMVQRGQYQPALEQFNRTLEDLRSHKSPVVQAMVEDDLGSVYAALGEYDRALREFRHSQQTARSNTNPSTEFDALIDEGNLYLAQSRYQAAASVFKRALRLVGEESLTSKRAKALRGVGAAQTGQGNAAGLPKLLAARELAHLRHDDPTETETNLNLGDFYFSRGELNAARVAYARLRELAEHSLSASQLAKAWASEARVDLAAGRLEAARDNVEHALAAIDDQRSQINPPQLRSRFFQSTRSYYDLYISILMGLDRKTHDPKFARMALAAAENSRARALTELLSEQSMYQKSPVAPELLARRAAAQDALHAAAYRAARAAAAPEVANSALRASVDSAKSALDDIEGEIRNSNRRYGGLVRPEPLAVEEMQSAWLDGQATVLEYWLSDKESYLWVLTCRSLRSFRLPSVKRIESSSARLRALLVAGNQVPPGLSLQALPQYRTQVETEISGLTDALGAMLLRPVRKTIGAGTLVVVPDGALCGIPFGLFDPGVSVVYLPSVASLRWLRKGAYRAVDAPSLAVFADPVFSGQDPRLARQASAERVAALDPPLRGALRDTRAAVLTRLLWSRREAQSIGDQLPPESRWLALDFAANRDAVMNAEWGKYSAVHFATHALIDHKSPQLSGIVLSLYDEQGHSIDGFLRATDIYTLSMSAQLVVLSTCDSAGDASGAGNDTYTLANAFFYAGTPRVLASLWAVDDEAAATLMAHFYRGLLGKRESPAQALREAQRATAADPRWHFPYYWSGFVLQGDWQ